MGLQKVALHSIRKIMDGVLRSVAPLCRHRKLNPMYFDRFISLQTHIKIKSKISEGCGLIPVPSLWQRLHTPDILRNYFIYSPVTGELTRIELLHGPPTPTF